MHLLAIAEHGKRGRSNNRHGLLLMAWSMLWEILWPLVLGFALSGVIQAVVSHQSMAKALGGTEWKDMLSWI